MTRYISFCFAYHVSKRVSLCRLLLCWAFAVHSGLLANILGAQPPESTDGAALATDTAANAARPNILFCIADDASWPYCGAYGCQWVETPAFDRIARDGLLFTNAFTPNAKCAPSRACILTGRNSWQLKEAGNHWCYFPAEFQTYAECLSQHGYFVGETGKDWAPGFAVNANGEKRKMAGQSFESKQMKPPAKHISGNDYAANFADFLSASPADQPWCFWYGSTEPHRAYEFGVSLKNGWREPSDVDQVPEFWPDNDTVRTDMLDYAYELKYFDEHLGRMLKELENRGELANTVVVVTSDNGMPFPRCKGQAYGYSNHLPLAIMWPEGIKKPGREIDDYVSFVDFAPTFLEIAGIPWADSGMQPTAGRSLIEIFQSEMSGRVIAERDHVLLGKERHDIGRPDDVGYPIRAIVKDGWLLVKNFETGRWPAGNPETGYLNCDGSPTKSTILNLRRKGESEAFWEMCFGLRPSEELYNLTQDPACLNNLAADRNLHMRKAELLQQLESELTIQQDPRMLGEGSIFDSYPYADKSGKDFYKRFKAGEKLRAGWVEPSDFETAPNH